MSLLKYTSVIILVAFAKLPVKILSIERHRLPNWKSLRYLAFITTSHNRNIEVDSSRVESVDPLCHQTPRISLSSCSAILKKLVLSLHCYRIDATVPSVTYIFIRSRCRINREGRSFHLSTLPFSVYPEGILFQKPPHDSLHVSLASSSSHGLRWLERNQKSTHLIVSSSLLVVVFCQWEESGKDDFGVCVSAS